MTQTTSIFSVECPSCLTTFPVDPAKVPEGGVLARCSECQGVFRVEAPDQAVPTAKAQWAEPETPAARPPAPSSGFPAAEAPAPAARPETPADVSSRPEPAPDSALDSVDTPPGAVPTPAATLPVTDDLGLPHLDTTYAAPGPPAEAAAPMAPPRFGKRDPKEKAQRLARVLVSDMITYNADRHSQALANGTLEADFEEEIKKSWSEYVDQVGADVAESTPFFTDALNEILAQGKTLF